MRHCNPAGSFILIALAIAMLGATEPRSSSKLVDLNVIAVDSHGQPVTDLTGSEFRIADSGHDEEVAHFHHTRSDPWHPPSLGPNEFSNRSGPLTPHATVVLFDLLNQGFRTWADAAGRLTHTLESLPSPESLYVYLLTARGQLYTVHGIPGTDEGEAKLDKPGWTEQIKPLMDQSLRAVMSPQLPSTDDLTRVQMTFDAFAQLAIRLSRVPGRKNIVWITNGVPLSLRDLRDSSGRTLEYDDLLRKLSDRLDLYGVSVYPVRQLMLNVTRNGGPTGLETLGEFANDTGGRPDQGKDIGAAIAQAMTDVRGSYHIGYYRSVTPPDGKFHKIRVTCTRRGVRIQVKAGYYSLPGSVGGDASEIMGAAMETHFDASEIALHGRFTRDPNDPRQGRFEVKIDAGDVTFAETSDQFRADLRIATVGLVGSGRIESVPVIPFDFPLQYTAAEYAKVFRDGIDLTRTVKISPTVTKVRLIVFDTDSNAIGSLSTPVIGATQP